MQNQPRNHIPATLGKGLATLLLIGLFGCSAPKKPQVYYPPAPDLPRIQYLFSIEKASDLKAGFLSKTFAEGEFSFEKAFGAAFYQNKLYVVDSRQNGFAEIDFANKKFTFFTRDPERTGGELQQPFHIAIAPDGTKYITDKKSRQIVSYDAENRFLKRYPLEDKKGAPVSIAADDKLLYVGDPITHKVHILDRKTGASVKTLGEKREIYWPLSLAIDRTEKSLYIVDTVRFKIQKYTTSGEFISEFGTAGDSIGTFARPKAVAVTNDHKLMVVDAAFQNAQFFDDKQRLLMFFANRTGGPQDLMLPADIAISYELAPLLQKYAAPDFTLEYVIAITCQTGPSRVNLYGFGKRNGADYSTYDDEKVKE